MVCAGKAAAGVTDQLDNIPPVVSVKLTVLHHWRTYTVDRVVDRVIGWAPVQVEVRFRLKPTETGT